MCLYECVYVCGSDLFWEAHYNIQDLDMTYGEELDKNLKQYSLPKAVETLIERGEYDNKESEVTRVSVCVLCYCLCIVSQ